MNSSNRFQRSARSGAAPQNAKRSAFGVSRRALSSSSFSSVLMIDGVRLHTVTPCSSVVAQ
jgi:hypothetical protein